MAYYPDLTPYQYGWAEERYGEMPVFNVGWMEPPHPFPTGEVPAGFAERLFAFCHHEKLVNIAFAHQDCGYCDASYWQLLEEFHTHLGTGELRVAGKGRAYAAPSLIYHYVVAHSYLPPAEFITAVMDGPGADSLQNRAYRFYFMEECIMELLRQEGRLLVEPSQARGQILPPLVSGYREYVATGFGYALLPFLLFLMVPTLSVPLIIFLAVGIASRRRSLRKSFICPCGGRLTLAPQPPPNWAPPPYRPGSALSCEKCGFSLRPTLAPWTDPIGDVTGV